MRRDRVTLLASTLVFATGAFWGLYWLPVRRLAERGLAGAWGTLAIAGAAVVLLSPLAAMRRRAIARADRLALASVALGGAAFALYSVSFVYGRVAVVILLYFMTPVWSTLIGRYLMGWKPSRMRVAAVAVGLVGLVVMLSAGGDVPLPRGTGEWMALLAGLLWSVATTGMRVRSDLAPVEAAFVFACGATLAALLLVPALGPSSGGASLDNVGEALTVALVAGGLWWAVSIGALLWATVRLEPARVGILLMAEVLAGAGSAALVAGERLRALEVAGGTLVLLAGVLEVWPSRSPSRSDSG